MIPEMTLSPSMEHVLGLPEKVWLGKKDGEWPVLLFHTAQEAQTWQSAHDPSRVRRVWEISPLAIATERIVIVPEPTGYKWAGDLD
jgi:hypothetical protein